MEPYGRFYEFAVFIYARNWVIIDLDQNYTKVDSINSSLVLESTYGPRLSIEWMPIGVQITLKRNSQEESTFFPGDIHHFLIDNNTNDLEISVFEMPRKKISWLNFIMLSDNYQTEVQSLKFQDTDNSFFYNKFTFSNNKQCLLYLHGGPFQRHSNEYNEILSLARDSSFDIIAPHYPGDPFVGNSNKKKLYPGSVAHIDLLGRFTSNIKKSYEHLVCIGHSFGCYLGYQLLAGNVIENLVTVNGVFDTCTLKEISPITFNEISNIKMDFKEKNYSWHHFHCIGDLTVPIQQLNISLSRVQQKPKQNVFIDSNEHEITSKKVAIEIMKKII